MLRDWVSKQTAGGRHGTTPVIEIEAQSPSCESCAWSLHVDTTAPRLPNGQFPHTYRLKYISAACGQHNRCGTRHVN